MKKIDRQLWSSTNGRWIILLFAACAAFLWSKPLMAAQTADTPKIMLANPHKAFISPHGGRLEINQEVRVQEKSGDKILLFYIPGDATNLNLHVPGQTIARWSSAPVILDETGHVATAREKALQKHDELMGRLVTVKAQLAVWQQTGEDSAQELERRQSLMAAEMPALAAEQDVLQRSLALVEREISELPANPGLGQAITVTLAKNAKIGDRAQIDYSYNLNRCGWQALYDFNVRPDDGAGDMVDVRLLAEVWQFTGQDWDDTEIVLASLGTGPREPDPLRRWVVGGQEPKPEPRANATRARAAGALMSLKAEDAVTLAESAPMAPTLADTDSIYATWTLTARGLPEGKSRVEINSGTWKAPLQWLARPTTDNNRVWLMAKYELPQHQAWPVGQAQFSVDNQAVGEGEFNPQGREAVLYFGADPRVTVKTTVDTNRQGETGFINTSKTWTGAWTYTLSNEHAKPVRVKVERPAPIIGNENITVTYKDKPQAVRDEKEHMLYWEVTVPGHGKTSIEHSITISSPEKLPLLPAVP